MEIGAASFRSTGADHTVDELHEPRHVAAASLVDALTGRFNVFWDGSLQPGDPWRVKLAAHGWTSRRLVRQRLVEARRKPVPLKRKLSSAMSELQRI